MFIIKSAIDLLNAFLSLAVTSCTIGINMRSRAFEHLEIIQKLVCIFKYVLLYGEDLELVYNTNQVLIGAYDYPSSPNTPHLPHKS
jgi:hypothetical protein